MATLCGALAHVSALLALLALGPFGSFGPRPFWRFWPYGRSWLFGPYGQVFTADGHTYERAAIEAWLRENNTSPLIGQAALPAIH